jgi:lipoprotein NlpD
MSAPQPGREAGTPGGSSPARPQPAQPKPTSKTYIVKRGDTLTGIAKTHAVSPDKLRRWNSLSPEAAIQPGQELRVEDPAF